MSSGLATLNSSSRKRRPSNTVKGSRTMPTGWSWSGSQSPEISLDSTTIGNSASSTRTTRPSSMRRMEVVRKKLHRTLPRTKWRKSSWRTLSNRKSSLTRNARSKRMASAESLRMWNLRAQLLTTQTRTSRRRKRQQGKHSKRLIISSQSGKTLNTELWPNIKPSSMVKYRCTQTSRTG